MIEEFSFGNFWSFKDIQTLNLSAAKIKSKNPEIDSTNVITINDKLSLLKSKAIYGANASGKSNVIQALITFRQIIKNSIKDEKILKYTIVPFLLSTETEKEPTFFQLIFRYKNIRYRYGFEVDSEEFKSEWLYATPNIREIPLFIRENNKIIDISEKHYLEGFKLISLIDEGDKFDNEIFRNNFLFLSTVASFGFGKLSKKLINSIYSILIVNGLGDKNMFDIASSSLENR
ncbi:MAG: ATP/GTP-binding protein, partial [Saprospiraceae bacterium]